MPDGDVFDTHVPAGFRPACRAIVSRRAKDPAVMDEIVNVVTRWLQEHRSSDLPAIVQVVEGCWARKDAGGQAIDDAFDRLNGIRVAGGAEATERLVDAGKQELLKQRWADRRSWPDVSPRVDYEIGANILAITVARIMFSPAMQGGLIAKGYAKSLRDTEAWRQELQDRLLSSPSFRRLAVHMVENGDCVALKPVAKKRRKKMSQADLINVSLI